METLDKAVPINLRQLSRIIAQWVLAQPPLKCEMCDALIGPTPFDDLDPPGIDSLCARCAHE